MSKPIDESDTALLTEHFGYRPASLVDDIINSINTLAFKATDAIEQSLLSANPGQLGIKLPQRDTEDGEKEAAAMEERLKVEIESGVHQLETLFSTRIDHNFDKMEIVMLRSYLNIPPEVRGWIRMNHYEGLNFTPNPDGPTTESITLQRLKLRETQKLHTLLLSESAQNAATIASLKSLLSPPITEKVPKIEPSDTETELPSDHPAFAFLQNKGELTGDNTHPISTTTSFTISQLPALKSLLENLGPRIKELKDGNGKDGYVGEAEKSWRRERLEFVETETKKHLEHSRGLELGEMGEVRDGEWQGEGRKLQKGEVEDLERVVGMVGGAESIDAMDQSA